MQHQIYADISTGKIVGHALMWFVIIVITLGIGVFFYPYAFSAFVLNNTKVRKGSEVGRLRCNISVGGQIGHIIVWAIISIVTLGIGFIFYGFKVWQRCMSDTDIIWG